MLKQPGRQRANPRKFIAPFIALALFICSVQTLHARDKSEKPDKLFSSNDTLDITITGPWRDLQRDKKNQDPYPATLEFTDALGKPVQLDVTIGRRGITRQRVCDFPPIRLRFNKENVKNTMFRGQNSLKMVTHCEKAERFEQYYILEMLAYRMYNLITDFSFRVRALDVTYVDSETGNIDKDRFAFLIEDDSDVAKRNDLKKIDIAKIKLSQLEPYVTNELSLFEYLIGNVDWSPLRGPDPAECCHNVKLVGPEPLQKGDTAYPIPYDFDSSGLVNADYAIPPDGVPIKSVRQRLFRGYCFFNDTLEDARQKFLRQESAIYALLNNESRLYSRTRRNSNKYIEDFFDDIKDQKDFERRIIRKCRK